MAPAPAMFARGSTGGGVRFCRHVHFAPDLQGGEGGCLGGEGGRRSVRSSSSGADRPESFRRGGSAGWEGGCRGAGKGGARDVEKLRRRFVVAPLVVVLLWATGGQPHLGNLLDAQHMDLSFDHCGLLTAQFDEF